MSFFSLPPPETFQTVLPKNEDERVLQFLSVGDIVTEHIKRDLEVCIC